MLSLASQCQRTSWRKKNSDKKIVQSPENYLSYSRNLRESRICVKSKSANRKNSLKSNYAARTGRLSFIAFAMTSVYFSPEPVLNKTTRSRGVRKPDASSRS